MINFFLSEIDVSTKNIIRDWFKNLLKKTNIKEYIRTKYQK